MADLMRIRIEGKGEYGWMYKVTDADTGKNLPATSVRFELTPEHAPVQVTITLQVAEVSLECLAERKEDVLRIEAMLAGADIETRPVEATWIEGT